MFLRIGNPHHILVFQSHWRDREAASITGVIGPIAIHRQVHLLNARVDFRGITRFVIDHHGKGRVNVQHAIDIQQRIVRIIHELDLAQYAGLEVRISVDLLDVGVGSQWT